MLPSLFDYPQESREQIAASQLMLFSQRKPQPTIHRQIVYNIMYGIYSVAEYEELAVEYDLENAVSLLKDCLEECTEYKHYVASLLLNKQLDFSGLMDISLAIVVDFRQYVEAYPNKPATHQLAISIN